MSISTFTVQYQVLPLNVLPVPAFLAQKNCHRLVREVGLTIISLFQKGKPNEHSPIFLGALKTLYIGLQNTLYTGIQNT